MKCPNCQQRYFPRSDDVVDCEHCGHRFFADVSLPETFGETWKRIKESQALWPKVVLKEQKVKPRP
jgi:DNA-directed RNA polymerase subunit RPC12/RpoP